MNLLEKKAQTFLVSFKGNTIYYLQKPDGRCGQVISQKGSEVVAQFVDACIGVYSEYEDCFFCGITWDKFCLLDLELKLVLTIEKAFLDTGSKYKDYVKGIINDVRGVYDIKTLQLIIKEPNRIGSTSFGGISKDGYYYLSDTELGDLYLFNLNDDKPKMVHQNLKEYLNETTSKEHMPFAGFHNGHIVVCAENHMVVVNADTGEITDDYLPSWYERNTERYISRFVNQGNLIYGYSQFNLACFELNGSKIEEKFIYHLKEMPNTQNRHDYFRSVVPSGNSVWVLTNDSSYPCLIEFDASTGGWKNFWEIGKQFGIRGAMDLWVNGNRFYIKDMNNNMYVLEN